MINNNFISLFFILCFFANNTVGNCSEEKLEQTPEASVRKTTTDTFSAPPVYYNVEVGQWRYSNGRICTNCTPQQGFAKPVVDADMYYDPEIKKWRQSSMKGMVCHTCTAENGFQIPPTGKFQSNTMVLPQQRGKWCKNEVVSHYNTFMADVSVVDEQGNKIFWEVDSTSKAGYCLFNDQNEFIKIVE